MVPEARFEQFPIGRVRATEGWFAINIRDTGWTTNERMGAAAILEGNGPPFPDVGLNLRVLQPGQANGMYHAENNQEDFLVLSGECVVIIEGEERRLRAWDLVHCPAGTAHIFVGAGEGPCAIFMVGGRARAEHIDYMPNDTAARHGASVETASSSPDDVYAPFPDWEYAPSPASGGAPWE